MKKLRIKRKTIDLFRDRLLSLLIAAVMLLTSMNLVGLISNASANSDPVAGLASEIFDDDTTIRNDALHFYVRHWHTQEDTDAKLQGNQAGQEENTKNYFVIAEGYIVPNEKTGADPYAFYFVGQDNGDNTKELIPITETDKYDENYVTDYDTTKGSITLNVKILVNSAGSALERFSGFSISAGRDAVSYNEVKAGEDGVPSITITYNKYVHLVKGHVFYVRASKIVSGSNESFLFSEDNPEIDTAEVYTYKTDGTEPVDHKAGDIVMLDSTNACTTEAEVLAAGAKKEDVELTKFYSTAMGLHTDNALLAQDPDGRVFQFDLAAWYVQGIASQVGLVLDASGGFGFAYDYPDPINVYSVLGKDADRLLGTKISGIDNEDDRSKNGDGYLYPQRAGMIGYYEIVQNSGNINGNNRYRTWYFNSIDAQGKYTAYDSKIYSSDDYLSQFAKAYFPLTKNDADNDAFDFSNSKPIRKSDDFNEFAGIDNAASGWGGDNVPANFAGASGFNLGGTAKGRSAYVLSDASTPDGSFTLSFTAQMGSDWKEKDAEILYIGSNDGTVGDAAFRLVRQDRQLVLYYHGESKVLISNYTTTAAQTFTFTYDNDEGKIIFYLDGAQVADVDATIGNIDCIVFNPFDCGSSSANTSTDTFYVDEIFVYNTILNVNEVSRLIAAHNEKGNNVDADGSDFSWNNVFLTESQLALLLDTHKTDNSLNGWSGYSYFVFNASSAEFAPLAYWDGAKTDNSGYNGATIAYGADGKVRAGSANNIAGGAGWYFMVAANWNVAVSANTSKRMDGISPTITYYDVTEGEGSYTNFTYGTPNHEYPDFTAGSDSVFSYKPSSSSPTRFYIDDEGNLRCFFNSSNNAGGCSYVYELPDEKYVKTEAMQRILGNFATMLIDRSPATEVSAVRFSADVYSLNNKNLNPTDELKKLVLLDWSSDASDIAGLMSQRYVNGGFNDYQLSKNNVGQYNYTLTGGSNIYTALQSFRLNLMPTHNEEAARFVILITDGADDANNISKTVDEAKKLRDAGYTIMSVMFGGTTFNEDHEDYWPTWDHLCEISGNSEKQGEDYVFRADDLEQLMDKFSEAILDTIANALENYTVKNYIDPRFDVVGSDSTEYILGANGVVKIVGKETTVVDLKDVDYSDPKKAVTVSLAGTTDSLALAPNLRYDPAKDMYYLEWTGQNIPTSAEGAPLLGIWSAQFTLKAKEDFIGGNTVLTNGNDAEMNYVYDPKDPSPSSGTDKMYDDKYPSKGFPRTTVNVRLKSLETANLDGVLYKGEVISSAQLLTDIEGEYVTDTYYLEYLRRFAYQRYLYFLDSGEGKDIESELNMPLLDLLNKWLGLDGDNKQEDNTQDLKQFSVRYMYLPQVQYDESGKIAIDPKTKLASLTNNAGNLKDGKFDMDTADVLGILTYRWHKLDENGEAIDLGEKDYVIFDSDKTAYSITVEFTPLRVGDTVATLNASADPIDEIARRSFETYGTYMFAGRIIFRSEDAHKEGWTVATNKDLQKDFVFDREEIVNSYVKEEDKEGNPVYAWDPDYRPALYDAIQPDSSNYGEEDPVSLKNKDRTLVAESVYEQEVVSGGVALEMKLLIGELENLLDASGNFTFTVTATRNFQDTLWAQNLKTNEENPLDDFGTEFTLTFGISKEALQLEKLKGEAAENKSGYVTIFAKTTGIVGTFGKDDDVEMDGLPIGTYTFSLDKINKGDQKNKIQFSSVSNETDEKNFSADYFSEEVLDLEGNPKTHLKDPVLANFIAESETNTGHTVATFYIGTSKETTPERGNVGYSSGEARYTDARLGIVVLSTGTAKLVISEEDAQSNESFLYRITGKTFGGQTVDLVVSVKGGESTTIVLLPGTYTVTEISDWSWKYEEGEVKEVVGAEADESDEDVDGITLTVYDTVKVVYGHERNGSNWLGSERSEHGKFE